MSKKFQRKIEDFVCRNCDHKVIGSGYTNHCPKCLWSMHVDINPGDREEECGGMMKPVGATRKGETFVINQQCQSCGFERSNKLQEEDDFDALVKLTRSVFKGCDNH